MKTGSLRTLCALPVLCLLLLVQTNTLHAQHLPPHQRWYGVGDYEFFLGGWISTEDTTLGITGLWPFAESYGFDVLIKPTRDIAEINALVETAPSWGRLIPTTDLIEGHGRGSDVAFFFFDQENGEKKKQEGYCYVFVPSIVN